MSPTADEIDPGQPDGTVTVAAPITVLGKVRQLLDAFGDQRLGLGLTELSRRSGIPKATAHRLAQELVELGLLTRVSERYELGWGLYELGQLVPGPANLRAVARPAMLDLRTDTASVVHLSVLHGVECVYLERLAGQRETDVAMVVGTHVEAWTTVSGLVQLAFAERSVLDGIVAVLDDDPELPESGELRRYLGVVRQRRYVVERQTRKAGYKTFGVPILCQCRQVAVAAVSATVPLVRTDDEAVVKALWSAAASIREGLHGAAAACRAGHELAS